MVLANSQQLTSDSISVCIKTANSTEKDTTNGLTVEHTLAITPTTKRRASEYTPGLTAKNTRATGGMGSRTGLVALPIPKVNHAWADGRRASDLTGSKTRMSRLQ